MEMHTVLLTLLMIVGQNGQDLYKQALVKERGIGNLEEAIKLYERAAKAAGNDRELAAKALIAAARCHELLGDANALALYDRVIREYPEQQQAAVARDRSAELRHKNSDQPKPVVATGIPDFIG